jgi:hypothetical protein
MVLQYTDPVDDDGETGSDVILHRGDDKGGAGSRAHALQKAWRSDRLPQFPAGTGTDDRGLSAWLSFNFNEDGSLSGVDWVGYDTLDGDIRLHMTHMPGKENALVDTLSRMEVTGDYELKQEVFERALQTLRVVQAVDLFAHVRNRKLATVKIRRQSRHRDIWNMGAVLNSIRNARPIDQLPWKQQRARCAFILMVFIPLRMVVGARPINAKTQQGWRYE